MLLKSNFLFLLTCKCFAFFCGCEILNKGVYNCPSDLIYITTIVKYLLKHIYAVLEFKSQKCSYSKYSLFPHPFYQKMPTYLDRIKKKVKN